MQCPPSRRSQAKKLLTHGTVDAHVYAIGISPNADRILTELSDVSLCLIDVATSKKVASSKVDDKPMAGVIMSPNGKFAVSCDFAGAIRLWAMPD